MSVFISTKEAAEYLGLSRRTLEKYRVYGAGPQFYKLGRRAMYKPKDLDDWAEARRRASTSDLGLQAR